MFLIFPSLRNTKKVPVNIGTSVEIANVNQSAVKLCVISLEVGVQCR